MECNTAFSHTVPLLCKGHGRTPSSAVKNLDRLGAPEPTPFRYLPTTSTCKLTKGLHSESYSILWWGTNNLYSTRDGELYWLVRYSCRLQNSLNPPGQRCPDFLIATSLLNPSARHLTTCVCALMALATCQSGFLFLCPGNMPVNLGPPRDWTHLLAGPAVGLSDIHVTILKRPGWKVLLKILHVTPQRKCTTLVPEGIQYPGDFNNRGHSIYKELITTSIVLPRGYS